MRRNFVIALAGVLTILTIGCGTFGGDDGQQSTLLQSSERPAAGARGWNFEQTWSVDLEGDGDRERVVLLAQVDRSGDRILWQDGQPWVVYVEEPSGPRARTYVFARNVNAGRVDVFIEQAQANRSPRIIILERGGNRLAAWEVQYRGRDNVRVNSLLERDLDPATFVSGTRE